MPGCLPFVALDQQVQILEIVVVLGEENEAVLRRVK